MEKLHFDDFEDFVIEVTENYDAIKNNDEENDVAIIAKYAEATEIIENLVQYGYKIEEIQIKIPEYGGYEDEYIISLCNVNGSDIWCEPMKRENGYLDDDSAVIYVMDNCSSTALKHLDSGAIFEVSVGEEDEDDYECMCECNHCVNHPETSVSYYVNGKKTSEEEYDKALDRVYDAFDEARQKYNEFADIMNEYRHLFDW